MGEGWQSAAGEVNAAPVGVSRALLWVSMQQAKCVRSVSCIVVWVVPHVHEARQQRGAGMWMSSTCECCECVHWKLVLLVSLRAAMVLALFTVLIPPHTHAAIYRCAADRGLVLETSLILKGISGTFSRYSQTAAQ